MRLLMMGTGTFALPTFLKLCESDHDVVGLVTQPDRTGRGHHHHVNEMKQAAEERSLPVFQPVKVNAQDSLGRLRDYEADLFVVAAYGQILSSALLGIPRLGAINLHASLLPKYRGAAPIVYALQSGDAETGVSIFRIEPKLDAGPVIGTVSTPIGPKETAGDLEERLARLAAPLTLDVISQMEAGTVRESFQDASLVSTAPRLKKEQGAIDWSQPSRAVNCHIRAMQPWPKPFTFLHSADRPPLRLLILDVDAVNVAVEETPAGTFVDSGDASQIIVRTGNGAVQVNRLQPAGKKPMTAAEFLRGHALHRGDRLGPDLP